MAEEERRVTVTGSGRIKKKTAWDKFWGNFVQQDMEDVGDKIINGFANAVKRVISDTVDMILFGETRSNRPPSVFNATGRIGTMISYNSMFDNSSKKKKPEVKSGFNFDEIGKIIVDSSEDAEACIAQMIDIESKYGNVRVGDLYDYFHESTPHTLASYGWHNFAAAKVKPLNDGTYLIVPPMIELLQTK